ncbi:diguanylate cyclase domain-containing protein [Lactobacillus sp.]|uniref:diguanylate cyclase domain-containing protein n=1 Tax=Lactobacillus sp. TaxID=1591 RepID=UPI003EFB1A06
MFKLFKKANHRDYGLIIVAVILLLIFNLSFLDYVQNKQRSIERHHAESLANNFSRILNEEMKNSLSLTTTLKEVVLSHDGKVTNFNETSADLLKNNSAIRALQLAPAGKVTYVYPLKGNEAGKIDLLRDPARAPLAKYAITHKTTVIQGPTQLKQGGKGIIIRTPIFIKKKFWGFSIAIIKVPQIFTSTDKNLRSASYNYRLEKQVSPLNKKYVTVMTSGKNLDEPLTLTFKTDGQATWRLSLSPKAGWNYMRGNLVVGYILIFDLVILYLVTWAVSRLIANRLLKEEAGLDPLTQALNRQGFDLALQDLGKKGQETTVVMLDIDDFKSINDVFGHQAGDGVLVELTKNLRANFGPNSIIGRNGGDEFVVAMPDKMENCQNAIERMSKMRQRIVMDDKEIPFSISMGYSEFPGQAKDYEEAIKYADAALYEVKIAGKNSFASYSSSISKNKYHNQLGLGLRALAAGDPIPLMVLRIENGEIIFVNKSLLDLFGCELYSDFYEHYDNSLLNLIAPADRERLEEEYSDFIKYAEDDERFHSDGHILTLDARVIPVYCDVKYSINQRYGPLIFMGITLMN